MLLKTAQIILNADRQLRMELNTANYPERQLARVACYPWRLGNAVQDIMYEVYKQYPSAQIIFVPAKKSLSNETGHKTETVEAIFEEHTVDFAIGSWGNNTTQLNAVPLFESQTYYIVHRAFIADYVRNVDKFFQRHKDGLELSLIPKDVPIVQELINGIQAPSAIGAPAPFIRAHANNVYVDENVYEHVAYLCKKGQASMFAPTLQVIRNFRNCPEDICVFPAQNDGKKILYTYYLYYPADRKLSEFQKSFISIVKSLFGTYETDALRQIRGV